MPSVQPLTPPVFPPSAEEADQGRKWIAVKQMTAKTAIQTENLNRLDHDASFRK